jgi:hypothetical protein
MIDQRRKTVLMALECAMSLSKAISDAGGNVPVEELKTMSFMNFLSDIAAPNNIRFVFVKPEEIPVGPFE